MPLGFLLGAGSQNMHVGEELATFAVHFLWVYCSLHTTRLPDLLRGIGHRAACFAEAAGRSATLPEDWYSTRNGEHQNLSWPDRSG